MAIHALQGTLGLVVVAIFMGCSASAEWTTQDSPSGRFTIEVPGNPDTQQQDLPIGDGQSATAVISVVEAGDDGYTYSEISLPPGTGYDLDAGIQGSVDNTLASIERQLEATGSASIDTIETTEFDGIDARSYGGTMDVGDTTFTFRALVYVHDDVLVQIVAFDRNGDNVEDVDRFFDSMEPSA